MLLLMSGGNLPLWGSGFSLGGQIHEADRSDKFPMRTSTEHLPSWKPLQCFGDSRLGWPPKKSSTLHNTFLLESSEGKREFLTSMIQKLNMLKAKEKETTNIPAIYMCACACVKESLFFQFPPKRGAWQMIWENLWKISHHPRQPLCSYPLSSSKPLAGVCWLLCS